MSDQQGGTTRGPGAGGKLVPIVRSTAAVPAALQFRFWQARWEPVIGATRTGPAGPGFAASNTIWDLGDLTVSQVRAPGLDLRRGQGQIRRDQIDTWFLTCVRRGAIAHHAGGGVARLLPGLAALHSLGEPFERHRTAGEWTSIFFSRDFAPELNAALERARNRPLDTPLGALLADFVTAVERRLPELAAGEAGSVAAMLRPMLAACLAPTPDRLAEAAPAIAETRRERVRRAVRRHLGSPSLSPARLGRMVGISRSNLYRLYEAEGGVARYIAVIRLRAAHAALSDAADLRPIHLVAESVGFADAASFSRVFRRAFGCAPGELRRATLSGAGLSAQPPGPIAPVEDLPALLRRL